MKLQAFFWLSASAAVPACAPQSDRDNPTPVGFRILDLADTTRLFTAGEKAKPRPLHLFLWYPAAADSQGSMALSDYLLDPGSQDPAGSPAAIRRYRERLEQELDTVFDQRDLDSLLSVRVPVIPGASPAQGRLPGLILETGLNAPAYLYTDLAEQLAQRGIVVATLPSFGSAVGKGLTFDSVGIATQVADLEHAVMHVSSLPFVDPSRITLGGWSVGGLAALLVASRRADSIAAVLSLDGAVGYEYGVSLARQAGLQMGCFSRPLLHLSGTRPGRFRVPKSRALFEAHPGPGAYWGLIQGFSHGDFTSFYGTRSPWFGSRKDEREVREGQRKLVKLTAAFVGGGAAVGTPQWDSIRTQMPVEELGPGERPKDC